MSTDPRHLGPEEIAGYQQRTLAAEDLLHVSDHLARCGACRGQVDSAERLDNTVRALHTDLATFGEEIEHPPLDEIATFVDGGLEDLERELLASHLEICPVCAEDVEDLRVVRLSLTGSSVKAASNRSRAWVGYAAATALAAGVAGLIVWVGTRPAPVPSGPRQAEAPAVERPATVSSGPAPVMTLADGGATVTLLADGSVFGLPALAEDEAASIRLALAQGITLPPLVADLGGPPGTLMSRAPDASAFQPLRPLTTAIETDRPLFEWSPLAGATAYVLSIFDRDFNKMAESPPVAATRWQLEGALARGRTYLWQVRASRADEYIVVPAPPAPEARFRVLPLADADRLANLRRHHRDFHLVLGILLARAGDLDEAERELERLVTANPGIPEPQRLLDSLRGQRKALSGRR